MSSPFYPGPLKRYACRATSVAGNPIFEWRLTPCSLTDPVILLLHDDTLPIIFVPGIMGSNLMDLHTHPIWRLDTNFFGQAWTLFRHMALKGPGTRQSQLHPDRTQVDHRGKVPTRAAGSVPGFTKDQQTIYREHRFWGEISDGNYHDFLLWLEDHLNGQSPDPTQWSDFSPDQPVMMASPVPGQPAPQFHLPPGLRMKIHDFPHDRHEKPMDPLSSDDLLKRAAFYMPVYACGYNWLASNRQAAITLQQRIEHVLKQENCQQVLLITHSMGGLVARCCAQLPGMEDKIAGIIHGVMPATGAPVAYRRCKVGMYDEDPLTSQVVGRNGREITAVFAQAPGALQLLPTAEYPAGWLQIREHTRINIQAVPKSDPYQEIYLRRDRWWGLLREAWLSPKDGVAITWADYKQNIGFAKDFHEQIRDYYHPQTYVYYGADSHVPSFETITWQLKRGTLPADGTAPTPMQVAMLGFEGIRDNGSNPLRVGGQAQVLPSIAIISPHLYSTSHWDLVALKQDGSVDGTVPISSGSAPGRSGSSAVKQQFKMTGFTHENAYQDDQVRRVVLYAIQKIAATAKTRANT